MLTEREKLRYTVSSQRPVFRDIYVAGHFIVHIFIDDTDDKSCSKLLIVDIFLEFGK